MIESALKGILILALGSVISKMGYNILRTILEKIIGVDIFIEKRELKDAILGINISKSLSLLVSVYLFLIFLMQSLKEVGLFYKEIGIIVEKFPIVVYLFFLVVFGLLSSEVVRRYLRNVKIPFSEEEANIAKYVSFFVIFYIGLEIIGIQIEIVNFTIKMIIASILFAFSLAMGIGYGLALSEELKRGRK